MTPAKIVAPATGHLFTIEECRQQCEVIAIDVDSDGVASHPDDGLLLSYLDAAVDMAEDFTGLSISLKTYAVALDSFPVARSSRLAPSQGAIELPKPPLANVVSFVAGTGGDALPLEIDTDYLVDDYSAFATLRPVVSWPSVHAAPNKIVITFTAGYEVSSDGVAAVPSAIRQAIMLTLADWYRNREDSNDKQLFTLPNGAQTLLRPKRVRLGMA